MEKLINSSCADFGGPERFYGISKDENNKEYFHFAYRTSSKSQIFGDSREIESSEYETFRNKTLETIFSEFFLLKLNQYPDLLNVKFNSPENKLDIASNSYDIDVSCGRVIIKLRKPNIGLNQITNATVSIESLQKKPDDLTIHANDRKVTLDQVINVNWDQNDCGTQRFVYGISKTKTKNKYCGKSTSFSADFSKIFNN